MTFVKFAGNHHQVGDDDAPTDPPLETAESVIGATSQLHRASNDTDPTLNPVSKTLSLFEPGLLFALTLLRRQASRLWDDKLLDAHLSCLPLVVR